MDYMKTVDRCIHYECSVWTFIQWPPLYPEILRIRRKTVDSQSINCSWWCFWFVFINPVIAIMKSLFHRIKNQLNNKLSYCNRIKSLVMHYTKKNTLNNKLRYCNRIKSLVMHYTKKKLRLAMGFLQWKMIQIRSM